MTAVNKLEKAFDLVMSIHQDEIEELQKQHPGVDVWEHLDNILFEIEILQLILSPYDKPSDDKTAQ